MLVAEVADPKKGDYVIDVCAAPGGKSLHMGDKMEGYGTVDARDVSQYKVNLIEENIQRTILLMYRQECRMLLFLIRIQNCLQMS